MFNAHLSLFSERLCLRADVHRPRGMSSFWSSTRVFKVSCWIKSWLHMAQHLTPWVLHDPFVPALDTSFKNHYPSAQAICAIVLKLCASKTRTTPLVYGSLGSLANCNKHIVVDWVYAVEFRIWVLSSSSSFCSCASVTCRSNSM
jgi:hypothetical protein